MEIRIKKLIKESIFSDDFKELKENSVIEFSKCGIVVVYGPNGAGKTTLANILGKHPNTEFTLDYGSKEITNEDEEKIFYNIEDQNGRNIIQGETEDFILGDNIKREYELKREIENDFDQLYNNVLIPSLKSLFRISTKTSPFNKKIKNVELVEYISDLANNKAKGKNIDRSKFIDTIDSLKKIKIGEIDESKYNYLINDYQSKKSIISQISKLVEKDIQINNSVRRIEENQDAIGILEKYEYLKDCIVCDRDIEREKLLDKKKKSKEDNYNSLDDKTKQILDDIINTIGDDDPFNIKSEMLETIIDGDFSRIEKLTNKFSDYFELYNNKITNFFADCLFENKLTSIFKEYETIKKEKQIFTHEDALFIEKFVNDCLDKKIELKRDSDGNLDLLLGDKKFLNKDRTKLSLSNGEQNFISLAFELLKAKKVEYPVIILDDPISSFDSIYKNKIAYSIIKFLNEKQQIILTHNTDLIKLLEHQSPSCFNLYFLNNTVGENNGFIRILKEEQKLMLYLHELINFFRSDVFKEIIDEKSFLISTIPFARGYAQITNKTELKNKLTNLMHGYKKDTEDMSGIYNELFETDIFKTPYEVSAEEISKITIDDLKILNNEKYPLLDKTLIHTLTYLFLRLNVEKKLAEKYSINTKKYDMLNSIINKSFDNSSQENIERRIFLLSRKTLLNEFNHFEIDMNIFQPAIDITNSALKKEKEDILRFLDEI